jgi:hypothetical protein
MAIMKMICQRRLAYRSLSMKQAKISSKPANEALVTLAYNLDMDSEN